DFAKLAFTLPELNAAKVKAPLQQICLGALLALYDFEQYKSKKEDEKKLKHIQLLCSSKQKAQARREVQEAQSIADSVYFTRDIVNQPANHKKPPVLATIIKKEARKTKLKFKMLDERTMKKHGMNALLGVSSGSPVPPRLVILEHGRKRRGKPSLCLVGKGITFDSGGISLKPSKNMDEMKMDMAGAAAVAGAMLAISKLNLPLHVIGIMPLSENMPDGKAQRPGDIVKAMNGKSIEVLNTDAEGRLVLADALAYAEKTYKPDYIVDAATLTGAVLVCLGKHASGLLGNDEQLKRRLIEAGEAVHERCWELPLWDEYKEMVKGKLADVKNIGSESGEAGTITAAAFLSNFLKNRTRWAHLDIAGTAWDDGSKPFKHAGATGVGVRLFIELAKGLS
ncbi:leucyl aminopeptidase, partial [Candidatus Micrarchaeota archaeon]